MEWPYQTVLVRVVEALEKGVGECLRPWQIRRVAKADADALLHNAEARATERLMLEQTEREIAELRVGTKRLDADHKLVNCDTPRPLLLEGPDKESAVPSETTPLTPSQFAGAVQNMAAADQLQRGVNLKKIALLAEEEAEQIDRDSQIAQCNDSSPTQEFDADWFARWRNAAQDVSSEEMQRLWGKLLAGEVAKPGNYSLHTIDFLARMSSADADLLARIAPFVTGAGIVKVDDDFFKEKGINFSDFLYLDDMGLFNGVNGNLIYNPESTEHQGRAIIILHCGRQAMVFDMGEFTDPPKKLSFDIYTMTRVGREILSLAGIAPDMDYLVKVAQKGVDAGAEKAHLGNLSEDHRSVQNTRIIAEKPISNHVEK